MLVTLLKFRDVVYLLVIAGLYIWTQELRLEISGTDLKIVNGRLLNEQKSRQVSDELIELKRKQQDATQQVLVQYVDRIRNVPVACAADANDRAASAGVRDIIHRRQPAPLGGAPTPLQGPGVGTGPGSSK